MVLTVQVYFVQIECYCVDQLGFCMRREMAILSGILCLK